MFEDRRLLLDFPDFVANTWLNLASATWFLTTPQPPKPSMLHVIDGTWAQARRMSHRIPGLAALPRLSVAPPEPGVMRLREAHADWAMGTMEAIAAAVRAEGDPAGALALERAHALFVHRSFSLRRAMPDEPPEEPPEERRCRRGAR